MPVEALSTDLSTGVEVIQVGSRAQLVEDGFLVDVSSVALEAGIKHPTCLTRAVWDQFVEVPAGVMCQDVNGRLWDVLWMYRCHVRGPLSPVRQWRGGLINWLTFRVCVRNTNGKPKPVTLKASSGPGDDMQPVITILLEEED